MRRGLTVGALAAFLGYLFGYVRGMSNGTTAVRDAWQRAAARNG